MTQDRDEVVARAFCKDFCALEGDATHVCECDSWQGYLRETQAAIAAHEKWLADNGMVIVRKPVPHITAYPEVNDG